jgi:hypothetical protein
VSKAVLLPLPFFLLVCLLNSYFITGLHVFFRGVGLTNEKTQES